MATTAPGTITLRQTEHNYPIGTTVGAWIRAETRAARLQSPAGPPPRTAIATATVADDGSLTFTGLPDFRYINLYAKVDEENRYLSTSTWPQRTR